MSDLKPAKDETAAELVARFLRANNYDDTLVSFLAEAGLPPDTGSDTSSGAMSIEKVLQEKKMYDLTQRFERVAVEEQDNGWHLPAPSAPHVVTMLPSTANILNVSVESLQTSIASTALTPHLLVSTAARGLHALRTTPPYELTDLELPGGDAPTLAWTLIRQRFLLTASMSGRLALFDVASQMLLGERRDHAKYVVRVVAREYDQGAWIATAAWDGRVLLYRVTLSNEKTPRLDAPVGEIKTPTNPEAILFIPHPELTEPVLLLARRDSTFLYYHSLPASASIDPAADGSPVALPLLGRQNLAPHSNAWIAFTPAALAPHPTDPSLLAVATNHTPHMKVIIVRLLLPPPGGDPHANTPFPVAPVPQASSLLDGGSSAAAAEARRILAVQEREDAAIQVQVSTRAPQTGYSTPVVVWRADGCGVYVNGDDGVVRGVEAASGRIVADSLSGAHEPGTKVRCLWAGRVDGGRELLVSGGFDRRLVVWTCAS